MEVLKGDGEALKGDSEALMGDVEPLKDNGDFKDVGETPKCDGDIGNVKRLWTLILLSSTRPTVCDTGST